MNSVNYEWEIGVTRWQCKNEGNLGRSLIFSISSLLPCVDCALLPFQWTPTPTIYLINSVQCPRPFRHSMRRKKKRRLRRRGCEGGIRERGNLFQYPEYPYSLTLERESTTHRGCMVWRTKYRLNNIRLSIMLGGALLLIKLII